MKLGIITVAFAFGAFALTACPSCKPSTYTPGPDASAAAPPGKSSVGEACAASCTNLFVLGCSEGAADAGCLGTCVEWQTTHRADLRPWCVMDASSPEEVQACGGSASCTR